MRKHPRQSPRARERRSPQKPQRPRSRLRRPQAPHGFLSAFDELLPPDKLPTVPPRRGRKPRVPLAALLTSLVFHVPNATGTLAEHCALLFEDVLSDRACADRRARLPWQVFADLMARALRPLARKQCHPEAFWRGWRLVALDGTQFSLANTPANNAARPKARSRRGRSAFAKLTTGVLVELGLHNPLAAAIGQHGQSEWKLALSLLARLPKGALRLARPLAWLRGVCERSRDRLSTGGQPFSDSRPHAGQSPNPLTLP